MMSLKCLSYLCNLNKKWEIVSGFENFSTNYGSELYNNLPNHKSVLRQDKSSISEVCLLKWFMYWQSSDCAEKVRTASFIEDMRMEQRFCEKLATRRSSGRMERRAYLYLNFPFRSSGYCQVNIGVEELWLLLGLTKNTSQEDFEWECVCGGGGWHIGVWRIFFFFF